MNVVPKGFLFASTEAGFKYSGRDDLGLIYSQTEAVGAGAFTRNIFQAAPVKVAKNILDEKDTLRGIVINAGQANACTGEKGIQDCLKSLYLVTDLFKLSNKSILPASTGVIGDRMDLSRWEKAVLDLKKNLSSQPLCAAKAMMTTDTFPKLSWRSISFKGGQGTIMGIAKGAGMICPNMATMLGFILTDFQIEASVWKDILFRAVEASFNRISIDGDTSTNDCVLGLANGAANIQVDLGDYETIEESLKEVCQELAFYIVQDAEGGTKIIRIKVKGAKNNDQAKAAARTVAHSPLVKTAFFGEEANWGRIVAALGRCGAEFDPDRISVYIGKIPLFVQGNPLEKEFNELLIPILKRREIVVNIDLDQGEGEYDLLTSDLSLDYVRINSEYRS